jgi:hypothetical protein
VKQAGEATDVCRIWFINAEGTATCGLQHQYMPYVHGVATTALGVLPVPACYRLMQRRAHLYRSCDTRQHRPIVNAGPGKLEMQQWHCFLCSTVAYRLWVV